jgi:hypothetical protein
MDADSATTDRIFWSKADDFIEDSLTANRSCQKKIFNTSPMTDGLAAPALGGKSNSVHPISAVTPNIKKFR